MAKFKITKYKKPVPRWVNELIGFNPIFYKTFEDSKASVMLDIARIIVYDFQYVRRNSLEPFKNHYIIEDTPNSIVISSRNYNKYLEIRIELDSQEEIESLYEQEFYENIKSCKS